MRVQRDSGNTSTLAGYLSYTLESADSYRFAGQTVTFSFYARAGANYSASGGILAMTFLSGTGTDQNVQNSWTGSATIASGNATLTTSWQRFTFTGTVASSATEIGFYGISNWLGTAGANDYYEITGVQLELGSVATTFSRAGGTLQGELGACMRYCQVYAPGNTGQIFNTGMAMSTTQSVGALAYGLQMRQTPSVTISAAGDFGVISSNGNRNGCSALAISTNPNSNALGYTATVGAVLTAGNAANLASNANAATITISSEL